MIRIRIYPITVVETHSYATDADRLFAGERHERLKELLAFNPEHGDAVKGVEGVRQFIWQTEDGGKDDVQIVYFFHDLEMPLFLLALCQGEFVEFDAEFCAELQKLTAELVAEYRRPKTRLTILSDGIA